MFEPTAQSLAATQDKSSEDCTGMLLWDLAETRGECTCALVAVTMHLTATRSEPQAAPKPRSKRSSRAQEGWEGARRGRVGAGPRSTPRVE